MDQRQQSDAIELATAEGWECHCKGINESGECRDAERQQAVAQAAQIWAWRKRNRCTLWILQTPWCGA